MKRTALLLIFLCTSACDAPGPLKAERNAKDLFSPSEGNTVLVEAVLIVGSPLPHINLRRTAAPNETYNRADVTLPSARVSILQGDAVFAYSDDPAQPGRYIPPTSSPNVAPTTVYKLEVVLENEPTVRATTTTPARMYIDHVALVDYDNLDRELRRLKLFSSDDPYSAPENQIEYVAGALEVQIQSDTQSVSHQFSMLSLEQDSELLFNLFDDEEDEEDKPERRATSPLIRAQDGQIYMPWEGINYAGRYKVKLFAVDQNWFDLVRTDNVHADRDVGEAGQGFQRPLFHIENGIGLFASAAVDSFGFVVFP